MEDYNTELHLRIDWSELDLFGHVNNVAFFKYIQASRVNYWDKIGLTQLYTHHKIGIMLASTSCRFITPLFYPGQIRILAKVDSVGNSSFAISHKIMDASNAIAAEAQDVMVLYDFNNNKKVNIPAEIRQAIEKTENRKFASQSKN